MIETGIAAYLNADAGLTALVGTRIFPVLAPQGVTAPYVIFARAGAARSSTTCGTDKKVAGTWQFDAYAKTYKTAAQIARALRLALIDYTGLMGDTPVDRVFLETEFDLDDPEPGLFRVSQTYTIWYLEE